MNYKIMVLFSTMLLITLLILGCSPSVENLASQKFIIGVSESSINYLDEVSITIKKGTFSKETTITVSNHNITEQDSGFSLLSAYEFGPSGLVFNIPAQLVIQYDPRDIPSNMSETDLGLYLLEENGWVLLEGSTVNTEQNTVSAPISHFSVMGCGRKRAGSGVSAGDNTRTPSLPEAEEKVEDGYATAWFKANILFNSGSTRDDSNPNQASQYDRTNYYFGAYVSWEPVTYVQYYQVRFVFNRNPPENWAWSENYTEQSKYTQFPFSFKEGLIYHLGKDYLKPNYVGLFQLSEKLGGKHGFPLLGFKEEIYDVQVANGLNDKLLLSEIQEFTYAYYDGWEIWVRGVTETLTK